MLRRRKVALAVPLLALALVWGVAACGKKAAEGGDIATAASAGAAPASKPSAGATKRDLMPEMRRWAQCMREQGADVPDPDPVEGKFVFDQPEKNTPAGQRFEKATEACLKYDTFSDYREPMGAAELEAWLVWAQCMRKEGIAVSDPDPVKGMPPMIPIDIMRNQPAVAEKARKACFDQAEAARQARHQ